jgi:peptide/nickel transport system permease protein
MLHFIVRRAILGLCVCVAVLVVSFALTRLAGDVASGIAGPSATATDIAIIRHNYGLDQPIIVQFLEWLQAASEGDFGRSLLYHAPVAELIWSHLPVTLLLGLVGMSIAVLIGVPLGIVAAVYEGSATDHAIGLVALIGQAMPGFWLGLLLIIWFGLDLQWLPIAGADTWSGFILPGVVLAFSAIPALMRLTRAGMIEALASDYARTARAKGLEQTAVVLKHALRNAAVPVVSIAAVQLGFMLGGSVVIEAVFALHGLGYLAWESISKDDFPVIQAVVLLLAVLYVGLTFLADVLNAWLDPALRRPAGAP